MNLHNRVFGFSFALTTLVFSQGCGNGAPQTGATSLGVTPDSKNLAKEIQTDRKNFEKRLAKAISVLQDKPSGTSIVLQLDRDNSYKEPLQIVPVLEEELRQYDLGGLGAIRKRGTDKKYEILVNVDLTIDGIAHAVAGGVELFKTAFEEDYFLNQADNEKSKIMIEEARAMRVSGDFRKYAKKNRVAAQLYLKAQFFAEMKVLELSSRLDKEGLYSTLEKEKGQQIYDYINSTFLAPLVDPEDGLSSDDVQVLFHIIHGSKKKISTISEFYGFFLSAK